MITTQLFDITLVLLRNRPSDVSLSYISTKTSLPLPWLKKFQSGDIPDPSVNKIQTLYEFLTKEKLIKFRG